MKNVRFSLLFVFSTLLAIGIQSQDFVPENYCGTPPGKTAWLKQYQLNPDLYQTRGDTLMMVPISLHILLNDDGEGHPNYERVFDGFCQLNIDFEDSGIQFYIKGDINFIKSSMWDSHGSVLEGAEMMFSNNIDSTINCYVVADPAGNCGYNLPYAGIALSDNCVDEGLHTWAHEIGHNLSVQHTFLGWEGDLYNYNDTTPLEVYYDYTYFKDTLIIDTLIIDTADVEFVERINCVIAADGFCDTYPDYLSYRWPCNSENQSIAQQKDPDGVDFRSDGTLFMSYSQDECANRFSYEQIQAMRANILDEKPELIADPQVPNELAGIPEKLYPLEGEMVQFNDVELKWHAVEGALGYIVNIARISDQNIWQSGFTRDTVFFAKNMLQNFDYFWQVRAVNGASTCTEFTSMTLIDPADITDVSYLASNSKLTIFPNIFRQSEFVQVECELEKIKKLDYTIINGASQIIDKGDLRFNNGKASIELQGQDPGVYFIHFQHPELLAIKKIIISQ